MAREAILAFDVGTSSVKAAAVDVKNGELVAYKSTSYPLLFPQAGYIEIDPDTLWDALVSSFAQVHKETEGVCEFIGICFSWFSNCLILADKDMKPLTNILQFEDARAAGDTFEYFKKKDPNGYCKEHNLPPISMFLAPRGEALKTLWFKQNRPDIFEKARYMFDNQQFVLSRLGVEPAQDDSLSYQKLVEDVRKREWSADLLDLYEIPHDLCKERIVGCTEIVGEVDHIGEVKFPKKIPVIIGAHDEICGTFGTGCLPEKKGSIANIMGTSDTMCFFSDYTNREEFPSSGYLPVRTPFGRYNVYGHGYTMTGAALEWYAKQYFPGEGRGVFGRLFGEARFDAKGSVQFVPGFNRNKVGMRGITLKTTPMDIITALAEGITYECHYSMQRNDGMMFDECGVHIDRIVVSGGGSQSDSFLQLRADIMGLPIQRTDSPHACSIGVAVIAATSLGVYGSFGQAADAIVRLGVTFEPNGQLHDAYMAKEPAYKEFRDVINPEVRH
ncbi:MAG: hypothetical protein LBR77_07365 [Lachnospiraceae bacterium]|jgi:xylulokinase|nr:hypothetical protein [Lachnospiraceae bacterium]